MNSSFWQQFLKVFVSLSIVVGIVIGIFFFQSAHSERMASLAKDEALLEQARRVTAQLFHQKITDLMALAEGESLKRYLHGGNIRNWVYLAREFETFSRHKVYYDQIRFIDVDGNEKIRVNYNSGSPAIIPRTKLQNKFHRYYFTESVKLRKREVYISPLDLNMEQKKIEIPFKPMIRFGTPIFDGYGKKRGVLLVNYSARELLDRIQEIFVRGGGEFAMLNKDGHLILGVTEDELWGFMFGRKASFPRDYPRVWNMISTQQNGRFDFGKGSFLYTTANPLSDALNVPTIVEGKNNFLVPSGQDNDIYWKFISRFPSGNIMFFRDQASFYTALFISILWVVGIVSLNFARLSVQKSQALLELEKLANTDALTSVASRRRFVVESEAEFVRAKRYSRNLALIMLDADHFKAVNDTFGHAVGDEVLQQLADICQSNVREPDLLARYGGEEFIILLPESDLEGACQLADRICMQVASLPLQTSTEEVVMTVSMGVSVISREDNSFSCLLNRVDRAMYDAKQQGRNRVCVKEGKPS